MKERTTIAPLKEQELRQPEKGSRALWRSTKRHPVMTISVIVLIALVALTIIGGYFFNWSWMGFSSSPPGIKTLWDWLQLLIIPAVLVIIGYAINSTLSSSNEQKSTQRRDQTEREIALDNQQEVALQAYIDKLAELLLHEHLRESQPTNEVRKIARVRTLTVLRCLDSERKRSVLQFLHESRLIDKGKPIVDLSGAELVRAELVRADLQGASLVRTNLSGANLSESNLARTDLLGTNLSGANLEGANLEGANLEGANLARADLSRTRLWGARITQEQRKAARSSEGAVGLDEIIEIQEEPMPRHTRTSTS